MTFKSPTEIMLAALRRDTSKLSEKMAAKVPAMLEPFGVPASKAGRCAMCGQVIREGDSCIGLDLQPAFVDDLYMACRGSDMVCANCGPFMTADGLMVSGHGAFSAEEGYLPFRKWGEITALLLEPPKPPFVMVRATANNQHMAWRAPVSMSREQFYVRVGLRDLKIRRSHLKQGVQDAVALGEAIADYRARKSGKPAKAAGKTLPNPFNHMDPDIKNIQHGQLSDLAPIVAAGNPKLTAALSRLMGLTLGESWAMRFVLTPDAGNTESQN